MHRSVDPSRPTWRSRTTRSLSLSAVAVLSVATASAAVLVPGAAHAATRGTHAAARPGAAVNLTAAKAAAAKAAADPSWPVAGHDLANSRNNGKERLIDANTVTTLHQKWSVPLPGNLAATPAVVGDSVYLPDKAGNMWAFDAATGSVRWSTQISTYTGVRGDLTRATPAVAAGRLIFGDQPLATAHPGVSIIAVNASDGALQWKTLVDTTTTAKITGAPVIDGNTVYIGVSSGDEANANCCTFKGSVVALNATTGAIIWQTYMVPAGYTGGAVWGGSPVVDHLSGMLYVATGNNYSVPDGVCSDPDQTGCTVATPDNHADSIVALRLTTGAIGWSLRTTDADAWTRACAGQPTCGPDWDFGSAPNEFTTTINGVSRRLIGVGQKSGIYWAVDAYTGQLVWETQVGPAPIMWGSATDNTRIYVGIDNRNAKPYKLINGKTVYGGAWSALDSATGKIVWQTADPQGVGDYGFVSVARGVVYVGSGSGEGNNMYALRATTGSIRWKFASGGAVMGGAAIVNGVVYWATGYYTVFCPSGNTCGTTYALYAFTP